MSSQRRVENKRAFFDYQVLETIEAGLVLTGEEIKSFRAGQVSLNAAFVRPLQSGERQQVELWLINGHFAQTQEPDRSRKLLVHRQEIDRLIGKVQEKGLTLIPIELYLRHGRLKVSVGLARGKRQFEKRETLKRRDLDRELRRTVKGA